MVKQVAFPWVKKHCLHEWYIYNIYIFNPKCSDNHVMLLKQGCSYSGRKGFSCACVMHLPRATTSSSILVIQKIIFQGRGEHPTLTKTSPKPNSDHQQTKIQVVCVRKRCPAWEQEQCCSTEAGEQLSLLSIMPRKHAIWGYSSFVTPRSYKHRREWNLNSVWIRLNKLVSFLGCSLTRCKPLHLPVQQRSGSSLCVSFCCALAGFRKAEGHLLLQEERKAFICLCWRGVCGRRRFATWGGKEAVSLLPDPAGTRCAACPAPAWWRLPLCREQPSCGKLREAQVRQLKQSAGTEALILLCERPEGKKKLASRVS